MTRRPLSRDGNVVVNLILQTLKDVEGHLEIASLLIKEEKIDSAALRCLSALNAISDAEAQIGVCDGIVSRRRSNTVTAKIRDCRREVWRLAIDIKKASPFIIRRSSQARSLLRSFLAYEWTDKISAQAM